MPNSKSETNLKSSNLKSRSRLVRVLVGIPIISAAGRRVHRALPLQPPTATAARAGSLRASAALGLRYREARGQSRFRLRRVYEGGENARAVNAIADRLHAVPTVPKMISPCSRRDFRSLAASDTIRIVRHIENSTSQKCLIPQRACGPKCSWLQQGPLQYRGPQAAK